MRIKLSTLRKLIRETIEEVQGVNLPPTNKIVLLNDGSFNPVHRGHVNVTLASKKYAESVGLKVVGLYMMPKHDDWVKRKFSDPSERLPGEDRLDMVIDATSGTDIDISDWDLKQSTYANNKKLTSHFESLHPGATCVLIIGEDYGSCTPMPCFEYDGESWFIRLPRTEGLSSTKIRQAAKKKTGLENLAYPRVQNYMSKLYGVA